jgi:hypothetical protein
MSDLFSSRTRLQTHGPFEKSVDHAERGASCSTLSQYSPSDICANQPGDETGCRSLRPAGTVPG